MAKRQLVLLFGLIALVVRSQEVELPSDFRQHNLTEFNSSLFSPVFALDRNDPQSIALWTRWQWQTPDGDPTSIFVNYTRRLNSESVVGAGFLQHNTGIFLQTGGALNYAYALELESGAQIAFGVNLFAYQQKLATEIFEPNVVVGLPGIEDTNDFILQLAPSLRFKLKQFNIGIVAENLFDRNFTTNEKVTGPDEKIYIGWAAYSIPVTIFGNSESFVQPTVYMKTMPNLDNQFGITTLFSTPKFWVQAGYNNFYGPSGGLGGRFFRRFSVGALVEFGTSPELDGTDPTFELVTAYSFTPRAAKKKIQEEEPVEEEEELITEEQQEELDRQQEEERLAALQREQDSINAANKEQELVDERARQQRALDSIAEVRRQDALAEAERFKQQQERDSIATAERTRAAAAQAERLAAQRRQDSIAAVRRAEEERLAAQRRQDSIAAVRQAEEEARQKAQEEEVQPEAGEKYEEVATADGLQPGFYLVANVFGTKKYFERFMKTLTDQGLQPKSFYREFNKYNYVYLQRYNTMQEARRARDSKFNGRYQDQTWIFRVVGN